MLITQNELITPYEIPKEIDEKIPEYFYPAMLGELVSIFGIDRFGREFVTEYGLDSSTGGWEMALKATCTKLDMQWLSEYWDGLEWYDSDIFDGIIEGRILKLFEKDEFVWPNSYYRYLTKKIE